MYKEPNLLFLCDGGIADIKWSEGQTSSDFLAENLSIMLGQLAKNISIDTQDQEVFTVGVGCSQPPRLLGYS